MGSTDAMGARCPIYGLSCGTAYNKRRCRCGVCRDWNKAHSRAKRDRQGPRKWTYTQKPDVVLKDRMTPLWEEFDKALRLDPAYVIRIAKAASRHAEKARSAVVNK